MEALNKVPLQGRKVVVFDLEIKNEIKPETGISWSDHHKMGISVGVARDYASGDTKIFMDDNLHELADLLESADLVVGFNIIQFDLPLLYATLKRPMPKVLPVYDILVQSRLAYRKGFVKGMRLDNHLAGTFGAESVKTEDGAQAPVFWQQGKLGRLVSYCVADVRRESELFEHIYRRGWVATDTFGRVDVADPNAFFRQLTAVEPTSMLAPGNDPTPPALPELKPTTFLGESTV